MQELIPLISEVAFPIVVTLYLLYRIEAARQCRRVDPESARANERSGLRSSSALSAVPD